MLFGGGSVRWMGVGVRGGNVMGDRDHKVIYHSDIKRQYETEWGGVIGIGYGIWIRER